MRSATPVAALVTAIHDGDFHNSDTSHPIDIQVTVTGFSEQLLAEDKYGLYLRDWSKGGKLHDDPVPDDDELALTVRLWVDASTEPR